MELLGHCKGGNFNISPSLFDDDSDDDDLFGAGTRKVE